MALQEDVMRFSYSWGVAGQLNEIDYQIASFSEPVKVSGAVVDCIVEQWDFTYVFPDRRLVGTVRRCLSEKVPGKVVHVEMNIRRVGQHADGDSRQHTTILRELIETRQEINQWFPAYRSRRLFIQRVMNRCSEPEVKIDIAGVGYWWGKLEGR